MSDFLRPEARALLWRWRELLAGGAALALGLWWVATAHGGVFLIGCALTAGGAGLAIAGIQRGRFRRGGGGAGVVEVVEGRLAYFGPETGGALAVGDISGIALSGRTWLVSGAGGERLMIPVDAEGAEALFDVFAALPGLDTRSLLTTLSEEPRHTVAIWQRNPRRLH